MLWIPVAFLSGCLVGGFAGGFIGTAGAKKKIEALEKRLEAAESRSSELIDKYDRRTDEALEKASEALQRDMNDFRFSAKEPPKSSISEPTMGDEEAETRPPFRISEEEYRNELATMDEDNLIFYQRDGVLVDNAGNPVESPETFIGEAVSKGLIDGEFDDEDKIYVHNEKLEQNFVIEINTMTHYEYEYDVSDFA